MATRIKTGATERPRNGNITMAPGAIHFWRDPALGQQGVDLLVARDTDHHYASHFHDEYVVSVFESGSQRHRVAGRDSLATPGHMVLIRPGEPHTGEPGAIGGRWSHRAFYPDAETLHAIAEAIFSGPQTRELDFGPSSFMADLAANREIAACHQLVSDGDRDPMERQQAFVEAMELLLTRYATFGRSPRKLGDERAALRAAISCMRDRLGEPDLCVADLAEAAGLSQYYFMRSFRKGFGMTAHNFLVQLRLNAARSFLAEGTSAADVAIQCGFFDQSHLIRHFRKVYGVTPGRYWTRPSMAA